MKSATLLKKNTPNFKAAVPVKNPKARDTMSLKGLLSLGGAQMEVEVHYASVHSMWILFDRDLAMGDVDNLALQIGSEFLEIGPCHADSTGELGRGMIRLVPHQVIFDLKALFFKSKIETMDTGLLNLPPMLGHKNKISSAFRHFVSDLSYDLNTYLVLLDQLDAQSAGEPELVRDIIQSNIIKDMGDSFWNHLDAITDMLEAQVARLNSIELGAYGHFFRRQIWNILLRSPFLARCNLKPRGYQGDSEMMQMIYRNEYQGDSTFGKLLHKYSVNQPAAQAVRNRRAEIASLLRINVERLRPSATEKFRVLSVACGPAHEIQDFLLDAAACSAIHVSLLDQDQAALDEAATMIGQIEKKLGTTISADYLQQSVRTLKPGERLQESWGHFDFIYSMGLFDYLVAPLAKTVVNCLFDLLKPGGELIIGNMSAGNPSQYYMEFWHDWKIFHRTEADMLAMAKDLVNASLKVKFDETGIQMMLHIQKHPDLAVLQQLTAVEGQVPCYEVA